MIFSLHPPSHTHTHTHLTQLYLHDKPEAGVNCPQDVYNALTEAIDTWHFETEFHSYILETHAVKKLRVHVVCSSGCGCGCGSKWRENIVCNHSHVYSIHMCPFAHTGVLVGTPTAEGASIAIASTNQFAQAAIYRGLMMMGNSDDGEGCISTCRCCMVVRRGCSSVWIACNFITRHSGHTQKKKQKKGVHHLCLPNTNGSVKINVNNSTSCLFAIMDAMIVNKNQVHAWHLVVCMKNKGTQQ